jgi:hypothetical protein
MAVPLEVKLTVPVGSGGPEGPTLAVMVTDCPTVEGFGVLVTVVVVPGWTTCVTVFEVLPSSGGKPW